MGFTIYSIGDNTSFDLAQGPVSGEIITNAPKVSPQSRNALSGTWT